MAACNSVEAIPAFIGSPWIDVIFSNIATYNYQCLKVVADDLSL